MEQLRDLEFRLFRGFGPFDIVVYWFQSAWSYLRACWGSIVLFFSSGPGLESIEVNAASSKGKRKGGIKSKLPDLEEIVLDHPNGEKTLNSNDKLSCNTGDRRLAGRGELEPAFLDAKDYPPGWLVFHPVLGVVSKTEADAFKPSLYRGSM